jgi:hypothetical protein
MFLIALSLLQTESYMKEFTLVFRTRIKVINDTSTDEPLNDTIKSLKYGLYRSSQIADQINNNEQDVLNKAAKDLNIFEGIELATVYIEDLKLTNFEKEELTAPYYQMHYKYTYELVADSKHYRCLAIYPNRTFILVDTETGEISEFKAQLLESYIVDESNRS